MISDELKLPPQPMSPEEREKRRALLRNIIAYKNLFQGEVGEMVYKHLMRATRVYGESFDADNPNITARNEGMRKIGLMVRRYVKRPLDEFIKEYGVEP